MDNRKIIETIRMLENEHLDIRTVTMGISLLDCIDSDYKKACNKIYDKMMRNTENLVATTTEVSKKYDIPIVNNRISVTPISLIAGATDLTDYTPFAETLDRVAKNVGVDFVGGFSALVQKGFNKGDRILIDSIPHAL